MPAPGSMGEAYIRVNVPSNSSIGRETFYLPTITSIDVSHYTSLSELPTIVMGFRNNFIIDLGNTRKISLTMQRNNPASYNDNQETNPELWSNGKWYRHLEKLLDFWQNFGRAYDDSGMLSGGFEFYYNPYDETLYPVMEYNVFLNGALSVQYSTTYMVVQMNLTVARMAGEGEGPGPKHVTLILHSGLSNYEDVEREVQAGTTVAVPSSPWDVPGYILDGWSRTSGASSPDADLEVGDRVVFEYQEDPIELWAVWVGPIGIWTSTGSGVQNFTTPDGTVQIRLYVVGGGGGAGGGAWASGVGGRTPGGGGGSGESRVYTILSGSMRPYTVTVGAGGSAGSRPNATIGGREGGQGGNGGDTYVVDDSLGTEVARAHGGNGGQGGQLESGGLLAQGGQPVDGTNAYGSYAGGNAGYGVAGEDGQTSSDNSGNEGKGAQPDSRWGGGAGGGAADFKEQFYVNGTYYPSSAGYYESIGGNGAGNDVETPTAGQVGGGGGSCDWAYGNAAPGGDGMVIAVFLRE